MYNQEKFIYGTRMRSYTTPVYARIWHPYARAYGYRIRERISGTRSIQGKRRPIRLVGRIQAYPNREITRLGFLPHIDTIESQQSFVNRERDLLLLARFQSHLLETFQLFNRTGHATPPSRGYTSGRPSRHPPYPYSLPQPLP